MHCDCLIVLLVFFWGGCICEKSQHTRVHENKVGLCAFLFALRFSSFTEANLPLKGIFTLKRQENANCFWCRTTLPVLTLILETFTVKFAFVNSDVLNNKPSYTASKHLNSPVVFMSVCSMCWRQHAQQTFCLFHCHCKLSPYKYFFLES